MADNIDHSNMQDQALVILIAFPILATISLVLRLYSRSLTKTFAAGMLELVPNVHYAHYEQMTFSYSLQQ